MRDLHLWRLLQADDSSSRELVALLQELAGLPLNERFPFFGFLHLALRHDEAEVRAAAVRVLHGAVGILAFRHIVRALHDPELTVRLAAAQALRGSASHDFPRWAHALFHPDAEVRRFILGPGAFPLSNWYTLHLLPDPDCAALLRPELGQLVLPGSALPLLFDHLRAGLLDRAAARDLIARMNWKECIDGLSRAEMRQPADVDQVLRMFGALKKQEADVDGELSTDALDALFELFWDPGGASDESGTTFFERLTKGLFTLEAVPRLRVICSLLVTAWRHSYWDPRAAELCAVFHPEMLRYDWVHRDVRRAAIRGFYVQGSRCPKSADEVVRQLVLHNLCRRPASGALDLWAIGGLLHMVEANPYQKLQEWVGLNAIVAAFLEDMEGSAAFFRHRDDSDKGRLFLIREITNQRRPSRPFIHALLVHAVSADDLDFLNPLGFQGTIDVVGELFRLGEQPGMSLSDTKVQHLAEIFGSRIASGPIDVFFCIWLNRPAAAELVLGLRILGVIARGVEAAALIKAVQGLELFTLTKFLKAVPACAGFPYGKECQLAEALADHPAEEARAWAKERIDSKPVLLPKPVTARSGQVPRLSDTDSDKIARSSETALGRTVRVAMGAGATGLCAALARRTAPTKPNLDVCLGLLVCHDPLDHVDEQFARFGSEAEPFLARLDLACVSTWLAEKHLPLLGHAWLYRWEQHNFAFCALLEALWAGGILEALAYARNMTSRCLGRNIWEAVALLLGIWRWRERTRFEASCTPQLGAVLIAALTSEFGPIAAGILVLFHEGKAAPELMTRLKEDTARRLPDVDAEVRRVLRFWLDSRGLPAATAPGRVPDVVAADLTERIRGSTDFDHLERWCGSDNIKVVEEAALRLLELAPTGLTLLARLITSRPASAATVTLASTVSLWPDSEALLTIVVFVRDAASSPELRFVAGVNLIRRGDDSLVDHVLAAACQQTEVPWFRQEDWQRLLGLGLTERQLALRLAVSAQPHAYLAALRHLTDCPRMEVEVRQALYAFLDCGTGRLAASRQQAAFWLWRHDDWSGLPILLQTAAGKGPPAIPNLLSGASDQLIEAATTACLIAGVDVVAEKSLFDLLNHEGVDPEARVRGFTQLLTEGTVLTVKNAVVQKWKHGRSREWKLRRLAETFAWGIQRGRELTGKLFSVKMLGSRKLGYTRFKQNNVYVSPLPILEGEMHGQDTVRGLIVHEIGHHMYHSDKGAQAVWKEAQDQGMHELLNLVADEHLERNLRALDVEFGNQLKRLASYAFQHLEREVPVDALLDGLQGRAFAVLTATRLGVARKKGHVVIESGRILQEMEQAGLSFARFCRALRMGLGNRHNDPKVARGLELFKGKFRQSTMQELWERAQKLKEIFGWEVQILRCLGQDEGLHPDDTDIFTASEGITDHELQGEIERVLEPKQRSGSKGGGGGKGGRPWLNINPDERFDVITNVVPVPFDPAQHTVLSAQVTRHARQLRRFLEELGLRLEPQRFRLQGKSFDKTRIQAVVTRNDPRMLIARQLESKTDLFLGVVLDCSGSMASGGSMDKAKLFAAMLADAARDLRGIDLRLFGFTDKVIWDAGTAQRCAAHGLMATDGNNDAAGLWHAAQVARASRRKAKVLVMISDGLPTECSVTALRGLVKKLTRLKMCCAQVAVRPLAEVCFPHYVLLEETDLDASVRRFGTVVARLVQKTLRGG